MSHISYESALARRDDLVRVAADRRRAGNVAAAKDASANKPARRKRIKLVPVSLARFVS